MSHTLFDFTLPFAPFAPFASVDALPPPAQRWLDVLTDASQAMSGALAGAAGLQDSPYPCLSAGWPDPLNPSAALAPAVALDWADTCARAGAVMSEARSRATLRQMALGQSWLAAQAQRMSTIDAGTLHERIEWLHGQAAQTVARLREINDDYLEAWFAAAGILADARLATRPVEAAGNDASVDSACARPDDGRTTRAARRRHH